MKKPLGIYRIENLLTGRTAIVVSTGSGNARRAAAAEARDLGHRDPETWLRTMPTDHVGPWRRASTCCLRIGVTTPLGGCHRSGEILRLDAHGSKRRTPR